jgi:hypothetical protein
MSNLAHIIWVKFINGKEASINKYIKILARLGTHRLTA